MDSHLNFLKLLYLLHHQNVSALFSGKPCLGYPEDEDEHLLEEFLVSQTPVPRKISKMCHRVLGKEANGNMHSCSECLKIRETKAVWDINAAAKCKVEILSDTEEPAEPEEPIRDQLYKNRSSRKTDSQ